MKKIIYALILVFCLSACSKNDKDDDKTTINYDLINSCELLSYSEINAILGIDLNDFSEDLSHIQISSANSKSCTFSWNSTSNPSEFHSILIYLTPKTAGSTAYETLLTGYLNQGRNFNGNTVFPIKVSNAEPTVLLWDYTNPFPTMEYQSHINEEVLISVSYYTSSNINFVNDGEDKLFQIFNQVVQKIESK